MLKHLLALLFSVLLASGISACSGAEGQTVDNKALSNDVNNALYAAMGEAQALKSSKCTDGSYEDAEGQWKVDITTSSAGSETVTTFIFTWEGYTHKNVTLKSGTVTIKYKIDTTTYNYSIAYDGDFDVEYDGESYDITWDVDMTFTTSTSQFTYTGTYSVDGDSYTFTYSATDDEIK